MDDNGQVGSTVEVVLYVPEGVEEGNYAEIIGKTVSTKAKGDWSTEMTIPSFVRRRSGDSASLGADPSAVSVMPAPVAGS